MRKAAAVTALVVALGGGLLVGLASWSGRVVQARLAQQTRELVALSPSFKLVKEQTDAGLFSSSHEVTLQLGCLPPAAGTGSATKTPLLIRYRNLVQHGPLPGARKLGAATIETELFTPSVWQAPLQKLIGKQALLRVHSQVGFGGDLVSDLSLPALSWADPKQGSFHSEPVVARLLGNVGEPTADSSYVLDIPKLDMTMSGPDGASLRVQVGRLLSETVLGKRADPKLWLRSEKTTGFVSSVELDGQVGSGKSQTRSHVSWDGIKFGSDAKVEHGVLASHYGFTTRGKINDFAIDKVELAASLKQVDAASFQRVLEALFGTTLSCDDAAALAAPETLLTTLQKELAALIVHNPECALDKLELELGGQRAELSYSVGTAGVAADDLTLPIMALLSSKGFVRGKLQASVGLVELVAHRVVNYDSKPSQETPLARTSALVGSFIDKFVREGYLQRSGDQLRVSAALEQGQLQINGRPLGLPALTSPLVP
ncbi:MAG: hypothetical protein JWN48_5149 [Myxococcaceae bacterium]|nr:hypothetical protein [Myxococcaceae bacterium]